MSLCSTIFRFEVKQLLRQPVQLFSLCFFLLAGLYSIYNGNEFIDRQWNAIDSLQQNAKAHLEDARQRFHADSTTERGRMFLKQAGIPQVVEFRNPPYAVNPPQTLSVLAIGQRDLMPYFDVVNIKRNYTTPANTEIVNPEKQAAGNFDLSFVLIYLFPLLVIALCYNVLSVEQEQQTDQLLAVQGISISRIILYKLVFRIGIVLALALLLSAIGFIFCSARLTIPLGDAFTWTYLVITYLIFWLALCILMISFKYGSMQNAICLLSCWLLLTLALPALINKIADSISPLSERSAFASRQRELTDHTWEMPVKQLLDSFYVNHPELRKFRKETDTVSYGNKRFIAYYDLLAIRINRTAIQYYAQNTRHQQVLSSLTRFNPVLQIQYLVNAVAETGLEDYLQYERQVNDFQQNWVRFMNSYMFFDQELNLQDLDHLPQFKRQANPSKSINILWASLYVWLVSALVVFCVSKFRFHSSNNLKIK